MGLEQDKERSKEVAQLVTRIVDFIRNYGSTSRTSKAYLESATSEQRRAMLERLNDLFIEQSQRLQPGTVIPPYLD